MREWVSEELLTKNRLSSFVDDPVSKSRYLGLFKWTKYLMPAFMISLFTGYLEYKLFSIAALTVTLFLFLYFLLLQEKTPAICSKCGEIMTKHKYTDGKHDQSLGTVFICYKCNSKFIYAEPSSYRYD